MYGKEDGNINYFVLNKFAFGFPRKFPAFGNNVLRWLIMEREGFFPPRLS